MPRPDRAAPCAIPRLDRSLRLAAAALALVWSTAAPAADDVYRLGPEDKVRLRVFEWRPSEDIVFEWKALNEEFVVGASGTLFVPLAGEVPASGNDPNDVARVIAERLRQRMHLAEPPDVSINVVQYRPFYVAGDVAHPGSFPYHPGLTVLEAVATAGGVQRPGDLGMIRLGREVINAEGEIAELALQADTLLVRRARLQAELAEADKVTLPPALSKRADEAGLARIIQNEIKIFDTRRLAFRTQSDALNALKLFLAKETESLTAQLGTLDTQMALINKELAGVSSLVEKGMAIAPRQLALERSVAQVQGDRLNMQTGMLRVQAEISRTDIALIELRNARTNEGSLELRDVQNRLDETLGRAETRKRLLYETRVSAPRAVADRLRRAALQPSYAVVRRNGGDSSESPATEATALDPGDSVKVTMPLPDDALGGDGETGQAQAENQLSTVQ